MLQKTLNGAEILEIVKESLSKDGLEFHTITYDDIGLTEDAYMQLEVGVKKPVIPTPFFHTQPGYRGPDLMLGDKLTPSIT